MLILGKKLIRVLKRLCLRTEVLLKRVSLTVPMQGEAPRISYGYRTIPDLSAHAHGGIVKFQHLAQLFPNHRWRFNLLYLVSSSIPLEAESLIKHCQRKRIPFLLNQNGISHPGSTPLSYQRDNKRIANLLSLADYVVFQSIFCRDSVSQVLDVHPAKSEILYNPVDLRRFVPERSNLERNNLATNKMKKTLTLLTAGTVNRLYRLKVALEVTAKVKKAIGACHLIVAGDLCWSNERAVIQQETAQLLNEFALVNDVSFVGKFTQLEAPEIYQRADILVHTKYIDPCPTVVIEAMACGLPVVFSASGGVPELVGNFAGVGVMERLSWTDFIIPDPQKLVEAVLTVYDKLPEFSESARQRAEEMFSLDKWIQRHQEIFLEFGFRPRE